MCFSRGDPAVTTAQRSLPKPFFSDLLAQSETSKAPIFAYDAGLRLAGTSRSKPALTCNDFLTTVQEHCRRDVQRN